MDALPLRLPNDSLSDGVVTLRYWREDDIPAFVAALQDPEVSHWLPLFPYPYTEEAARNSLLSYEEERRAGTGLYLAVTQTNTGEVQGWVGVSITGDDLAANTGYWVKAEARGHGVATRSLRLLVGWLFEDLGLRRVEAKTDVDNIPSQRLVTKCGFRQKAILRSELQTQTGRRDAYLYTMRPSDL